MPLGSKIGRRATSSTMILAMMCVVMAPYLRPAQAFSTDVAVRWLQDRLRLSSDSDFYLAANEAAAESPGSMGAFVDAFVRAYRGADIDRILAAMAFGFPEEGLGHLLGTSSLAIQSAVLGFRTAVHSYSGFVTPLGDRTYPSGLPLTAFLCAKFTNLSAAIAQGNAALPNGP